jgi:transcriptional regulator GlxA family with amidase domain
VTETANSWGDSSGSLSASTSTSKAFLSTFSRALPGQVRLVYPVSRRGDRSSVSLSGSAQMMAESVWSLSLQPQAHNARLSRMKRLPAYQSIATRQQPPRRIVMLAYSEAQILDITGPLEVFSMATRLLATESAPQKPGYTVELVALSAGPIAMSSGIRLIADRRIGEVRGHIDTLLVPGGQGALEASRNPALISWIRSAARRARRVGSICTGAFLLAEAGLLDGKEAATHWRACDALASFYPKVQVRPDPIFVRAGRVYTSAGVTAGIDLALALLEEDYGRGLALRVARELVMFLRRPGGQSQFSAQLTAQMADRQPLRELQAWMADNPGANLSVDELASRVAMSPRNFARVFTREASMTPASFVEKIRMEAARRRLEESTEGVDAIAARCGFGTYESMRRAFIRNLGVSPSAYRSRFALAESGDKHGGGRSKISARKGEQHAYSDSGLQRNDRSRRSRTVRSVKSTAGRRGYLRRRISRSHPHRQ